MRKHAPIACTDPTLTVAPATEKGPDMVETRTDTARTSQSRRSRRIERRRREIVSAAAEVFAEKGYAATTTREIADAADMAEGTLYNYFRSKRDILLAVAQEAEGQVARVLVEAGTLESREAMIALFDKVLDLSEARLASLRTLLSASWNDDSILNHYFVARLGRLFETLKVFIADRVSAGSFRPIDPSLGARLAIGMAAGLILPIVRGVEPLPSPADRRALAEATVDLLLDGIRVHPA
jgi:AcrR family transcriptional regulator